MPASSHLLKCPQTLQAWALLTAHPTLAVQQVRAGEAEGAALAHPPTPRDSPDAKVQVLVSTHLFQGCLLHSSAWLCLSSSHPGDA